MISAGYKRIERKFPFLKFQNKHWDRKWRLVVFDIEETSRSIRDLFRMKLKELGFGRLQKSVWITPHDVLADFKDFIEAKELKENVILIETEILHVSDPKLILNQLKTKIVDLYLKNPYLPKY